MTIRLIKLVFLLIFFVVPGAYASADIGLGTYGAVGDGVTDDTTNVQTALTVCSNQGITCVIEDGKNYRVTSAIFLYGNGSLKGFGTRSQMTIDMGSQKYPFNIGVLPGVAPYSPGPIWTGTISGVNFNMASMSVNGRFIQLYRTKGATITGNTFNSHDFPISLTGSGNDNGYLSGVTNYVRKNITISYNNVISQAEDNLVQQEGIGLSYFEGVNIISNTVTAVGDDAIGCHVCTDVVIKYNNVSSVDGAIFVSNVRRAEIAYNKVTRVPAKNGVFYQGVALIKLGFECITSTDGCTVTSDPAPTDYRVYGNVLTYPQGAIDIAGAIYLWSPRTQLYARNYVGENTITNNSSSISTTTLAAILLTVEPFSGVTWTDPDGLDTTVAKNRGFMSIDSNASNGAYPLGFRNTGASSAYYTGTTTFSNNTGYDVVLVYDPNVRNVDNFPTIPNYYASPSGSSTALCTNSTTEVCTIARAITVSTNGDVIEASCGTYDMGTGAVAVNKSVYLRPVTPLCATITSAPSAANFTIQLAGSDHPGSARLGAFNVYMTGTGNQVVTISAGAFDSNTELIGTAIKNGGVARHINDANTRGTTKLTNITMEGTIGSQAGYIQSLVPVGSKKVKISGSTFDLTASVANTPAILIQRTAGSAVSAWAWVKGNNVNVTVPASLANTVQGFGIRLDRLSTGVNLDGATTSSIIEDNNVTITSVNASAADSEAIVVSGSDATAVAYAPIIRNNSVTCNSPAARCISIGIDGTTASYVNDAQVYGNTVLGTFYDGSATPHGINLGRVTGGVVRGNYVRGFSAGILASMNTNGAITGNLVIGSTYAPLFVKGNTSVNVANNNVIMDDTILGVRHGSYGCIGVAVQGATNNAGANVVNNICKVNSGTGWKYVVVDASQVATFQKNDYLTVPTLTSPWSYQGSEQTTLAGWQGAQESTATSTDPAWVGGQTPATTGGFRLLPTSPLRNAGVRIADYFDYLGRAFNTKPSLGAWEYGSRDFSSTRSFR